MDIYQSSFYLKKPRIAELYNFLVTNRDAKPLSYGLHCRYPISPLDLSLIYAMKIGSPLDFAQIKDLRIDQRNLPLLRTIGQIYGLDLPLCYQQESGGWHDPADFLKFFGLSLAYDLNCERLMTYLLATFSKEELMSNQNACDIGYTFQDLLGDAEFVEFLQKHGVM